MAPLVIGHRGAPALAPENTLASIREAHKAGLSWVEFDVMLTRDRLPVVFHDHRLERLTQARGLVSQTTAERVLGLPVLDGEAGVPSLTDALRLVAELGLNLNLEIKVNRRGYRRLPEAWQVATAEVVCDALADWQPAPRCRVILGSFHAACLHVARLRLPQYDRDLKVGRRHHGWRRAVVETAPRILSFNHRYHGPRRIRRFAAAVPAVWAYTVNDPIAARALAEWGVSGIYTDSPGPILAGFDRS
jgi:glycerophosphoryl diester phosphodiesterase